MTVGEHFRDLALQIPSSSTYPPVSASIPPEAYSDRAGIERLLANAQGDVPAPPAGYALGYRIRSAEPGSVVFEFQPLPAHSNYGGTAHGGVLSAVADSAMGCAVLSMLAAGEWCAALELKVSFLRAVSCVGPPIEAVGRVTRLGATVAFAEAVLTVGGKPHVTATSTYAVKRAGERHLPGRSR